MRRRSLRLHSGLPSSSALRSSLRTMDRSDTPRAMSDTSFGVPRIVETRSYMAVETWIPAVATPAMLARRESGSISKLVFQDVRRAVGKLALLFSLYAGRRDGLATFLIQPNRGVECTIVVEPRGRLWGAPCSHRGEICFKLQGVIRRQHLVGSTFAACVVNSSPLFLTSLPIGVGELCLVSIRLLAVALPRRLLTRATSSNGCAQHLTRRLQQRTCAPNAACSKCPLRNGQVPSTVSLSDKSEQLGWAVGAQSAGNARDLCATL